jgi:S-adenosyl methyltransferase
VLHFISDADDPPEIVAALMSPLAPCSFVAISHLTADFAPEAVGGGVDSYNKLVPAPVVARTHAQVTGLFAGLPLVAPGVVPVSEWRPEMTVRPVADVHAGVARKPPRRWRVPARTLRWPAFRLATSPGRSSPWATGPTGRCRTGRATSRSSASRPPANWTRGCAPCRTAQQAHSRMTPQDDDAGRWRAARQLRRERPRWVIIWVAETRRYGAYPLFRTRRGLVVTAATAQEAAVQIDQIEQAARSPRTR